MQVRCDMEQQQTIRPFLTLSIGEGGVYNSSSTLIS